MKVNFRRILHYLWPEMKHHWVAFILVFVGYGIGSTFDAIIKPLIWQRVIDLFASPLGREVIFQKSLVALFLLALVVIIQNIGYRSGDFISSYFESQVMKKLYDFAFDKLLNHSYNFFANNFSGSIVAKAKRFSRQFETFFDTLVFPIYFSFINIAGILLVLWWKIPFLALIFLVWSAVYISITIIFIRKRLHYDAAEAAADSSVTGSLSDAILNVLNIKIFSSDRREKELFSSVTGDEEKKRRKAWYFANIQNLVQAFLMAFLQVLVLYLSILFWYKGLLSIGTVVLLQAYMLNLLDILWNLGRSLTRLIKSLTDMQEVVDIFDTPIDILDPKNPEPLKIKDGRIVFKNVSFAYKNGNPVLQNFNLEIAPGERIGLVGHSGAGKSTITKLLLRFADTLSGSILIDGQDVKNLKQNDLREVISYVPQESILFHRTIRENIAYGEPNASEEEIIDVSKKAFAHDFIVKLPKGYETLVGERGIKLSGGERQRVAIARAMLKNSPILVLDEATSSLDSVSEEYIQRGFEELMKGKTTIVIAHRLSTISKMDRIIVLQNGDIAEMGTHKELIEKNGVYADLWNHQSGGFLED